MQFRDVFLIAWTYVLFDLRGKVFDSEEVQLILESLFIISQLLGLMKVMGENVLLMFDLCLLLLVLFIGSLVDALPIFLADF